VDHKCEKCGQNEQLLKREIVSLPRVLVLHLKRFAQVQKENSIVIEKLHQKVEVPKNLNIGKRNFQDCTKVTYKIAHCSHKDAKDALPFKYPSPSTLGMASRFAAQKKLETEEDKDFKKAVEESTKIREAQMDDSSGVVVTDYHDSIEESPSFSDESQDADLRAAMKGLFLLRMNPKQKLLNKNYSKLTAAQARASNHRAQNSE
jgi:hypothetical protein